MQSPHGFRRRALAVSLAAIYNVASPPALANPTGACVSIPIGYGQSINGSLNSSSCVTTGPTDVYTFSGTAGQMVAISLDSIGAGGMSAPEDPVKSIGSGPAIAEVYAAAGTGRPPLPLPPNRVLLGP